MRRFFIILVILTLVLAALTWSIMLGPANIRQVTVIYVEKGPISTLVSATGQVASKHESELYFSTSGRITHVYVDEGDVVESGVVLAEMDKREAEANLRLVQAKLSRLSQELRQKKKEYQTTNQLFVVGGRSKSAVDDALSQVEMTQALHREVSEQLRLAEIELQKTKIVAPFPGVVIKRRAEEGQLAGPGQGYLVVSETGQQQVKANIDASESGQILVGQKVIISTDAYPDKEWNGKVAVMSPVVHTEGSSNTFLAWIEFTSKADDLRLGQQVDLNIVIASNLNAVKVPFSVLHGDGKVKTVTLIRDGKVKTQQVKIGIEDLTHTEITHGLAPGDMVVLNSSIELLDGEPVQVIEAR